MVKDALDRRTRDEDLQSETIGSYAYTLKPDVGEVVKTQWQLRLQRLKRELP